MHSQRTQVYSQLIVQEFMNAHPEEDGSVTCVRQYGKEAAKYGPETAIFLAPEAEAADCFLDNLRDHISGAAHDLNGPLFPELRELPSQQSRATAEILGEEQRFPVGGVLRRWHKQRHREGKITDQVHKDLCIFRRHSAKRLNNTMTSCLAPCATLWRRAFSAGWSSARQSHREPRRWDPSASGLHQTASRLHYFPAACPPPPPPGG